MHKAALYNGSCLQCCLCIETIPNQHSLGKRESFRCSELVIGRNQFNEPILQAHLGKTVKTYSINDVTIYRRFLKEGKSTLKLPKENVQLLISNCPPDQLLLFLKTLVGKLARHRTNPTRLYTAREKLLTLATGAAFTEISPLCEQDVACVKASSLQTTTPTGTKSNKRKQDFSTQDDKGNIQLNGVKTVRRRISLNNSLTDLTADQYKALDAILSGRNVFFTGSAGTGKSFLLKCAIGSLPPEHTFITASTGIAASHISGMTLHSFAGIGSGKAELDKCIELASRSVVANQWKRCKHLIIDEISMVPGDYFAKLEAVARVIRNNQEPFGGIQLIISGDFFQLPPVTQTNSNSSNNKSNNEKEARSRSFAFQTNAWRRCVQTTIVLNEVKRQTDTSFIDLLNHIRLGYCSPTVSKILKSTSAHKLDANGLQATRVSTHNDDVDSINLFSLEKLTGESHVFTATDNDKTMSKKIDELCPAQKELVLKVGAQVMLCKNINTKEGLVNGTRGVVVGFEKSLHGYPIIRTVDGKSRTITPECFTLKWNSGVTMMRRQLPLKLAWAISIHKSQGMTLDLVEISLSRVFEYGQAYVALSRARSLQGLKVIDFSPECVKAHPKVKEFYKSLNNYC